MAYHLLLPVSRGEHLPSWSLGRHRWGKEVVPHRVPRLLVFVFGRRWTDFLTDNTCCSFIINSNILDLQSILSRGTTLFEAKRAILLLDGRSRCTFWLSLVLLASSAAVIARSSVVHPCIAVVNIMSW